MLFLPVEQYQEGTFRGAWRMTVNSSPDNPLFVELAVRLSDGNFESKVTVPVTATQEQRQKFVQSWFAMLQAALEIAKPKEEEVKP